MPDEYWLEIPRWDEFQHYKNRDPIWIRDYVRQLDNPDYLGLTFAQRGLLHDLRLLYARRRRAIGLDTAAITRALGARTTNAQLFSLIEADLLAIAASKPLAARYQDASLEVEVEKKDLDLRPLPGLDQKTKTVDIDKISEHLLKDIPW